jgi:tetratricopeptide (TPR) repeat protein
VIRRAPLLQLETRLALGLLLADLGRTSEGLALLDEAAAEFTRLEDARGLAWAEKNRGFVLFASARYREAVAAFERAEATGGSSASPTSKASPRWVAPRRSLD